MVLSRIPLRSIQATLADLKAAFGEKQTFRDIEAIEAGSDFVKAIGDAVGSCDVLLAIIGPSWLTVVHNDGRRRLDDPDDFTRLEIFSALERDIRVIPVLVGEAKMPRGEDLPETLKKLARRQAHELSDKRWEYDLQNLVSVIEKAGVKRMPTHRPKETSVATAKNTSLKAIASALLVFVVIAIYSLGELDRQGIIGGMVISLIALVLGGIAYYDIRKKTTKGKSLAIATIVLAALLALALFGEFSSAGSSE